MKDEKDSKNQKDLASWFNSPERIAGLVFHAQRWVGTPFLSNSCELGKGVSCQKLAGELYRRSGCCDFEVPAVAMAHAKFSVVSLVEAWMAKRPEFRRIEVIDLVLPEELVAGDLLGFRIGRCVHHMGVYLGEGAFVHCMDKIGTVLSQISDGTWGPRLAVVWRPRP